MTNNVETIKAIRLAMENEKRGIESYLNFAFATKDETGKNMFIVLAKDELGHLEILERVAIDLVDRKGWAEVEVPASKIEAILPRLKAMDERVKGARGIGQVEALNAAMDQERRSAELYRGEMARANDPAARKLFAKLMEMEEAHYDILEAERDNITQTGFWFEIPEFNLEAE